MGACTSACKGASQAVSGVDREAVEMSVRGHKVGVAQRIKALVTDWQSRISSGEKIVLSPSEFLPKKDLKGITTTIDSTTPEKEMMKTAVYVSTNTLYRDQLKATVWNDISTSMKKNSKLPAALQKHGQKASDPAVDLALDRNIISGFIKAIDEGRPLVTDEEVKQVEEYHAKQKEKEKADDVNMKSAQKSTVLDEERKEQDQKNVMTKESGLPATDSTTAGGAATAATAASLTGAAVTQPPSPIQEEEEEKKQLRQEDRIDTMNTMTRTANPSLSTSTVDVNPIPPPADSVTRVTNTSENLDSIDNKPVSVERIASKDTWKQPRSEEREFVKDDQRSIDAAEIPPTLDTNTQPAGVPQEQQQHTAAYESIKRDEYLAPEKTTDPHTVVFHNDNSAAAGTTGTVQNKDSLSLLNKSEEFGDRRTMNDEPGMRYEKDQTIRV